MIAGLWARLVGYGVVPGPEAAVATAMRKEALAPARLLHALALALAYLVAAMVPREAAWMRLWPAQALAAIGRHSLRVFCLGLFLAWGASVVLARWPDDASWLDPLLVLGGASGLAAFAWAVERRRTWAAESGGRVRL